MKAPLWQVDFRMNGYLFGCILLLVFWGFTRLALSFKGSRTAIREFWWASFTAAWLGFTEPLFVPEYWNPPSILKFGRWDFESFPFCLAVGGITAVLTELPPFKGFLVDFYFHLERAWRCLLSFVSKATSGRIHPKPLDAPHADLLLSETELRTENMLLVTFAISVFGATSQLGINIIYKAAIVCLATAWFIAWRRPSLRWQILGGGISFTLLYTVVLVVTGHFYPTFFDHWNRPALSGLHFLGAPAEEYLYAFTYGAFWAPLYEAWKQVRVRQEETGYPS